MFILLYHILHDCVYFFSIAPVLDKEIVVVGNELAAAISKLPQYKRDVLLLSCFAGMTDKEIGKELGAIQQTISKRRLSSLLQLRKILDEEGFEWHDN